MTLPPSSSQSFSVSLSPKLAGLQCLFQSFLGVGFGTSGISYSLLSFNPTLFPEGPVGQIPGSWCLTTQVQLQLSLASRSVYMPSAKPSALTPCDYQLIKPQSAIANLPLYPSQREMEKWKMDISNDS